MPQPKGGKADPRVLKKNEDDLDIYVRLGLSKKILKEEADGLRIAKTAAVGLSSAMTYLAAEILDLSVNAAHYNKRKKILPKHINAAITGDAELDFLGREWIIKDGGKRNVNLNVDELGDDADRKNSKKKHPADEDNEE